MKCAASLSTSSSGVAVRCLLFRQRYACCGHTAKENRLSQSQFRCQVCGYTANADVNGARNILAAGHAVLACGEMVQSGRPLKQEPTEMIQATA
ncbi:putative transposase B, IS609 [Escherichia coli]|nr:transposase [Escherichia coli]SQJ70209.1 putative transposase B, IS609 [Escherichia coli]